MKSEPSRLDGNATWSSDFVINYVSSFIRQMQRGAEECTHVLSLTIFREGIRNIPIRFHNLLSSRSESQVASPSKETFDKYFERCRLLQSDSSESRQISQSAARAHEYVPLTFVNLSLSQCHCVNPTYHTSRCGEVISLVHLTHRDSLTIFIAVAKGTGVHNSISIYTQSFL